MRQKTAQKEVRMMLSSQLARTSGLILNVGRYESRKFLNRVNHDKPVSHFAPTWFYQNEKNKHKGTLKNIVPNLAANDYEQFLFSDFLTNSTHLLDFIKYRNQTALNINT